MGTLDRRRYWDGHDEHPARKRRRKTCLLCQGPADKDGWCPTCGVFGPRTPMERANMVGRAARFPGLVANNGPHSCLINPDGAAVLFGIDPAAYFGEPSIVEPNYAVDKYGDRRDPEHRGRQGDPFRKKAAA